MKDFLTEIGDVFGIERRLQEIDNGYKIYFNKKEGRYEVHNLNQKQGDTLCVVCPYESVDCRLINLVRRTRVERAHEIFESIEKDNEALAKKQEAEEKELAKLSYKAKLMEMKSRLTSKE